MDSSVIGKFTYNGVTIAFPIIGTTTFQELCATVSSRFQELKDGCFQLKYVLFDHPSCILESEMDLITMRMLFLSENQYSVDIEISKKQQNEDGSDDENISNAQLYLAEGQVNNDGDRFLGKFGTPTATTYLSNPWKNYISHVYQRFEGGVEEFRVKLVKYAIEKGFKFFYVKNDQQRVFAQCKKKFLEGCDWFVQATLCRTNGYFYIKRLNNDHTCQVRVRERTNSMMNSKIVSSIVIDKVRSNPFLKPIGIVEDFKKNYGLDISYHHAWYGLEIAKYEVVGDDNYCYQQLVWYVDALKRTNPRSHCVLEYDPDTSRFKRLFIAYKATIDGFQFCRPMLFLDGTFVKNKYKGTLLAATGKTANQGLYPLAFAVVDIENEANWTWFLENLYKCLDEHKRTITFISDRNKGLLEAVGSVFKGHHHAFCLQHLRENLKTKCPGGPGNGFIRDRMLYLFNNCAYAPTPEVYEMNFTLMWNEGGPRIQKFLKDLPKENWSNAFFKGSRYGDMWSNVAESFNKWIIKERMLPIHQLVDGIRVKIMHQIAKRQRKAETYVGVVCPKIEKKIEDLLEVGRHWDISFSSPGVFEVHSTPSVVVNIPQKECSCRKWQIESFPCSHAFAAIMKNETGNPYEHVEPYFSTEHYKLSYSFPISPIPEIEKPCVADPKEQAINPPLTKKQPGRPRVNRKKSFVEKRKITCGRCHRKGNHNRKTCPNVL